MLPRERGEKEKSSVNIRPENPHTAGGVAAATSAAHLSLSTRQSSAQSAQIVPVSHGLGTWMVLLVMRQPCSMKTATIGWTAKGVSANHRPPGMASWTQPCETQ